MSWKALKDIVRMVCLFITLWLIMGCIIYLGTIWLYINGAMEVLS